jgi:CIC family chloride channel protein
MASHLDYKINNPKELFFYFIIGLFAAITGPLWMKTTLKLRILFREVLKNHRLSIIFISFLVVGFLSLIHPAVLGSGKFFLEKELLSLVLDWRTLLLVFVIKFLATSICYSAGPSGGLFMPTLMVGATMGSFIGAIGSIVFPDIVSSSTGTYALVGMGAYFVTIIRAPFTSILIVFELTRNYNIILPVLIANVVAFMLSDKFTNGSIYEEISEQDGIHLPSRDDDDILDSSTVEDALVKDVYTFKYSDTVKDVYLKLKDSDISGFPIMKDSMLYGIVAKSDILKEMSQRNHNKLISDVCQTKIIKVYPDQSLLVALHLLNRFHISRLPVVSSLDSKNLIGIITANDILDNFGHKILSNKYKLTAEDEEYEEMIKESDSKKTDS